MYLPCFIYIYIIVFITIKSSSVSTGMSTNPKTLSPVNTPRAENFLLTIVVLGSNRLIRLKELTKQHTLRVPSDAQKGFLT
uniref:Secreted protein n=1 Tax=Heterorhabditis bacteriophora TaxID=37862 RepID=A0A1I7W8F5_HETBA